MTNSARFNPGCKVAWVTGLSDTSSCALSSSQIKFLERLNLPGWEIIRFNFPYEHSIDLSVGSIRAGYAGRKSLLKASLSNGRQFAMDSLGARRKQLVSSWEMLLSDAEQVLLIAGSCGMQIILDAGIDRRKKVAVIGLGPVGWGRPECRHLLLQGSHDYISRLFYRRNAVRIHAQRHLDYQSNQRIIDISNDWICSNILK